MKSLTSQGNTELKSKKYKGREWGVGGQWLEMLRGKIFTAPNRPANAVTKPQCCNPMIRNKFFILLATFILSSINGVGRISRIRYTTEMTEHTLRISVIRWCRAWWHSSYLWSSITNLVNRNLFWRGSLLEVVRWMYNSQRFKSTLAPVDVEMECHFTNSYS